MDAKMTVLFFFAVFLAMASADTKPSSVAEKTGTHVGAAAVTYRPAELIYHAPAVLTYPLSSSSQVISTNYDGVSASFVTSTPAYFV